MYASMTVCTWRTESSGEITRKYIRVNTGNFQYGTENGHARGLACQVRGPAHENGGRAIDIIGPTSTRPVANVNR